MKIKVENGQLLIKDDMGLLGAKTPNPKKQDADVVYCEYIPVQLTQADAEKRMKVRRAGKTYAKVSLKHPNPQYRGKRGIIWETRFLNGEEQYLLEIETMNITSEDGRTTWIGVTYPTGYSKIWFPSAILEDFEEYDEKGELKKNDSSRVD